MNKHKENKQNPGFSRRFWGGYSIIEVDGFIEKSLAELHKLQEENSKLRSTNTRLAKELELRRKSSFGELHKKIEETQALLSALQKLAVNDVADFLGHLPPKDIWNMLQKVSIEDQVVALHIMGNISKIVFPLIPTSHKKDLILALSKTQRLSPEKVRSVLALLQVPLEQEIETNTFLPCDHTMYISIFDSEPNPHDLLNRICAVDQKLGTKLQEDVILFSDVLHLDQMNMSMLLRQTDLYDWVQAVKSNEEELLRLVLSGMSRRMGEEFKENLEITGTVHPTHIQESQIRIVQELRAQIESGQIVLVRPK